MATIKQGLAGAAVIAAVLTGPFSAAVAAQTGGGTNALQGFSQNRSDPIKIESDTLEIRDKDRMALFIDNVRVTQGDTTLECKQLVVHYETPGPNATPAERQAAANSQSIRKLEAKGGVVVTQKGQTAVGDSGIYDPKANSMTLVGNVIVSQGSNVVRGDRLWVDLSTGLSRVESTRGRVQTVITPNSAQSPGAKPNGNRATTVIPVPPSRGQADGAERARRTPGPPQRLN